MPVTAVTEATFEQEVLSSELPVLIDFHADWCQPCKVQSPILEEVARELEGKLKVVKIDVDKNPRLKAEFRIQSIPQLFVVHQGQVVAHHDRGLAQKDQVLKLVQRFLPRSGNEVAPKELAALMTQRRAVAVDLRDEASFGRARIPGALNIPADQVTTRAQELVPRDGRIRVLYARSGDEARELADSLGKQGLQVAWLAGGFLHWQADGLEVEQP